MAKKKARSAEKIEITPAQLAKALEGISASILAVRRLVLKLDPSCTITISKNPPDTPAHFWDFDCPPPE